MRQGATVITANNRLSLELQREAFQASATNLIEKPFCFPYQIFLQNAFNTYCYQNPQSPLPILLTAQQQRFLWMEIIQEQSQGIVDTVQEAWKRCLNWSIDFQDPRFNLTAQTRKFQAWAQQMQIALDKMPAITSELLSRYLIQHQALPQIKTCIWVCFDDFTPEQRQLQEHMAAQGCTVLYSDIQPKTSREFLYELKDEDKEYEQLILWLQEELSQGKSKIGVVVPDLETCAPVLKRLLHQHLPQESYGLSLGQSLTEFPLVSHGLSWLNLNKPTLTNQQTQLLLHSPFLKHSKTEMLNRAKILQDCLLLQEETIPFTSFLKAIKPQEPYLEKILASLKPYPSSASPWEWVTLFSNQLASLGFPGEYSLDSENYQYYQKFLSLLEEFGQLQLITPIMDANQALAALEILAQNTVFQTKKNLAKIQILGLLEASGCVFESLWVMGMTSDCLPQKAKLSPFIPISLQQEKQMPYSCPSRELQLAETQINRLRNSADLRIFSFPRFIQDKPNTPSPLLSNLQAYKDLNEQKLFWGNCELIKYAENYLIPITMKIPVKGGSGLLAKQAQCPFKAFAAHRLHIRPSLQIADGLNALERGNTLHKVMELIWTQLQTQKALFEISPETLDLLIQESILTALKPHQENRPYSFSSLIQSVEYKRLTRLVQACLDWEKQRPPFSIKELEKTFTLELAGIKFNLRVDRIDSDEQGNQWVIDYKSSPPQTLPWKEDRPKEPQLLMYALLDKAINTLIFAVLKNGQILCKGLSEEEHYLSGINTLKAEEKWSEYRESWRIQLTSLAEEFSQGQCQPEPVSPGICQHCDFQSLCRI
jgi:probable DNA repair protein